jgi:hypothetical protein
MTVKEITPHSKDKYAGDRVLAKTGCDCCIALDGNKDAPMAQENA